MKWSGCHDGACIMTIENIGRPTVTRLRSAAPWMRWGLAGWLGFALWAWMSMGLASESVPRVLGLSQAMTYLDDSHPVVRLVSARADMIRARCTNLSEIETGLLDQSVHRARIRLRLELIRAFFDVILADYAYASIDEEMTLAFLRFKRASESLEQYERATEIEVTRLESVYLDALARRTNAANEQRGSRLTLALAMNRPSAIIDQVVEPSLASRNREPPDYDESVDQVVGHAPELLEIKMRIKGIREKSRNPCFDEYDGHSGDSTQGINTEQEELALAEAKLAIAELMLRKKMMELMHEIRYLDAQKTAAQADLLSRELALDKVRLQYEMEIRAQIGAANAAVAKAMERLKRLDYERAYAFEAFDALTGYLFGDGRQHVGTAGSGHSGD